MLEVEYHQRAFQNAKELFKETYIHSILKRRVHTDAIGDCFCINVTFTGIIVWYTNRTLKAVERKYITSEKEMLTVTYALSKF